MSNDELLKNKNIKMYFEQIDKILKGSPWVIRRELENIPIEYRKEYLKQCREVNSNFIFSMSSKDAMDAVSEISSDKEKIKVILNADKGIEECLFRKWSFLIKDPFIKMSLRETVNSKVDELSYEGIIRQIEEYEALKKQIDVAENEDEKYKYICESKNNNIKMLYFEETDDINRKEQIVQSMENTIEDDIKIEAEFAQKIILEFFEHSMGHLKEEEKLKLLAVFNRTNVKFGTFDNPGINGNMNNTNYEITIKEDLKNNPNLVITFLLHEYAHAISLENWKRADYAIDDMRFVEEGMADTFADLVLNTFAKNHSNEKYTVKGVDIDFSRSITEVSGYKKQNNIVRTMLYPLEQTEKDKQAVVAYYFDDKRKFFELTLGEEYAKNLIQDFNENPVYNDFGYDQIYSHNPNGFSEIREDSIYAIQNHMIKQMNERLKQEKLRTSIKQTGKKDIEQYELQEIDYCTIFNLRKEDIGNLQEVIGKKMSRLMRATSTITDKFVMEETMREIDKLTLALLALKHPEKSCECNKKLMELVNQEKKKSGERKQKINVQENGICAKTASKKSGSLSTHKIGMLTLSEQNDTIAKREIDTAIKNEIHKIKDYEQQI